MVWQYHSTWITRPVLLFFSPSYFWLFLLPPLFFLFIEDYNSDSSLTAAVSRSLNLTQALGEKCLNLDASTSSSDDEHHSRQSNSRVGIQTPSKTRLYNPLIQRNSMVTVPLSNLRFCLLFLWLAWELQLYA